MGEIADGIINGDFDQYTGEYIGKGGGFPRTKNGERWSGNYGGVINYLLKNGKNNLKKANRTIMCYGNEVLSSPFNTNGNKITGDYAKERFKYLKTICTKIQEDFPAFKTWYKEYISRHKTS